MPKAVVTSQLQAKIEATRVAWEDTIIYEAHVKGLTRLRDDVPPEVARHVSRACSRRR